MIVQPRSLEAGGGVAAEARSGMVEGEERIGDGAGFVSLRGRLY